MEPAAKLLTIRGLLSKGMFLMSSFKPSLNNETLLPSNNACKRLSKAENRKRSEACTLKEIHDAPKEQMALKLDNEYPYPTINFAI